jgi:hypothetical protein
MLGVVQDHSEQGGVALEADRQKALRDAVLRACTGYNADEVIRAIASTSATALIMIRMASRLSVRDRSPLRKHVGCSRGMPGVSGAGMLLSPVGGGRSSMSLSAVGGGQMTPFDSANRSLRSAVLGPPTVGGAGRWGSSRASGLHDGSGAGRGCTELTWAPLVRASSLGRLRTPRFHQCRAGLSVLVRCALSGLRRARSGDRRSLAAR